MTDTNTTRRQVLGTVALVLLLATAGCSVSIDLDEFNVSTPETVDGGGLDDGSDRGSGVGSDEGSGDGSNPTETGVESVGTGTQLTDVASDQTEALGDLRGYSLRVTENVTDRDGSLIQETRGRFDNERGRRYVNSTTRTTGSTEATIITEYFSTGEAVYERERLAGHDESSYNRYSRERLVDRSEPIRLDAIFDFDHGRADDGDHLFTVDSPSQIRVDYAEGMEVDEITLRVRVDDETGIVEEVYHVMVMTNEDGDRIVYGLHRLVHTIGVTDVEDPFWLTAARDRTTPVG